MLSPVFRVRRHTTLADSYATPSSGDTPQRPKAISSARARACQARKPNLLGSSAPTRAQADGKSSVQLQVFASSGPSGTALAGHFSAQRCTCYPSQAWAWAKACLSAATAKPLKSEEHPMNTTESTTSNIATLPAAPKPQTSREVIQANVQLLIEQLEAGHSEGLTANLTAMGRFHNYSFGNILEIARQRPDATRVAGLYAWNQLGRKVIKGQKGIRILAPMIGTRKKKDTEANKSKDPAAVNSPVLVGFRAVYVFDVSQTEGAELPAFTERTRGEVGEYRERLIDFTIAQGIELEFKESIAPALGMSYGGRIAILPGQEPAEEFSTLVHELAHEMLHKAERRTATTKTVRETEAEAIAFVVSQTIGLDAGRASADYIQLYHGNAALLTESLEVIQRTAALILSALETKEEAEQPETAPTTEQHTTNATDAVLAEVA